MSGFADKVTSVVDGKTYTVSTVRKFDVSETLVFESVNAFQAALGLGKRYARYEELTVMGGPVTDAMWVVFAGGAHKETVQMVASGKNWQMSKAAIRDTRAVATDGVSLRAQMRQQAKTSDRAIENLVAGMRKMGAHQHQPRPGWKCEVCATPDVTGTRW